MTCKGVCSRHRAIKPVGVGRYAAGQKRCQICEIFLDWQGIWCPCCGYRLRGKPRNTQYKDRLNATILKVGDIVGEYILKYHLKSIRDEEGEEVCQLWRVSQAKLKKDEVTEEQEVPITLV